MSNIDISDWDRLRQDQFLDRGLLIKEAVIKYDTGPEAANALGIHPKAFATLFKNYIGIGIRKWRETAEYKSGNADWKVYFEKPPVALKFGFKGKQTRPEVMGEMSA